MRDRVTRWLAHGTAALALAVAGAFQPGVVAEEPEIIFRATCGDLAGHRVDMSPTDPGEQEQWRAEHYRAGPPPEG